LVGIDGRADQCFDRSSSVMGRRPTWSDVKSESG
jgi:hypothetical protein